MNKGLIKINQQQTQLCILFFSWIIVQSFLYTYYGIKPILESEKYIGAAKYLIANGHLPQLRYSFYLTTTLLIAFCTKLGLGFAGVVALQLILNFLATFLFFKALFKLQTHSYSALCTTLLLIFNIPYQTWNFYLYTESVFYSFVLLFFT